MRNNLILMVLSSIFFSVIVFIGGTILNERIEEKNSVKKISFVNFNDDYTIVSGVIRNKGAGWELIQDAGHETIGITNVSQDKEKITISYNKTSKVNSIAVTLDETMTSEGFSTGASVGLEETMIYIYNEDGNLVNPIEYTSDSGNIWIQGIFKK